MANKLLGSMNVLFCLTSFFSSPNRIAVRNANGENSNLVSKGVSQITHTHTISIMETSNYLDLMFSWLSSVNAIPPEAIWKYNRIFLSLGTEHIHAICLEPPRVICPSSIVKLLTAITLTKHAACDKFSSPHEKTRMQCFSMSAAHS